MPKQLITIEVHYRKHNALVVGDPEEWAIESALDEWLESHEADVTITVKQIQCSPPRDLEDDFEHEAECESCQDE